MAEKEDRGLAPDPELADALLQWYDSHKRDLPWRRDPSAYHVWISEIMLQQTRVEAVKGYYARFLERFPDIRALAEADEDTCLKLWEGLGYYSRARNLRRAAQRIVEEYGGQMPSSAAELRKLPGIGPYTAAAIASIAFGERIPAVDGNLLRVFARLALYEKEIKRPAAAAAAADYFLRVMPGDRPGDFNQALMDLGAGICVPGGRPACAENPGEQAGRGPEEEERKDPAQKNDRSAQKDDRSGRNRDRSAQKDDRSGRNKDRSAQQNEGPGACPLQPFCRARRAGCMDRLPVMPAAKARGIERRTVLVIRDDDRILLRRRPLRGLLAGLYEFPNEEGWLSSCEALARARSYGCQPVHIRSLPDAVHIFTHKEWHMHGYEIRVGSFAEEEAGKGPADPFGPGREPDIRPEDAGKTEASADRPLPEAAGPGERESGICFSATIRDLQKKYALPSAYDVYAQVL